jgi:hypothetical protein
MRFWHQLAPRAATSVGAKTGGSPELIKVPECGCLGIRDHHRPLP